MFTKIITLNILVLTCCSTVFGGSAGSSNNIALGKPYTMSALPTRKWEKKYVIKANGGKIPNYHRLLTDGKISKSKMFWTSPKCVNFLGSTEYRIIIDLEAVYSINEIYLRHGARSKSGALLPRKDEFYVSMDNVNFYKAGEAVNDVDPKLKIYHRDYDGGKFFDGIKRFSSGKIVARGRYVMVKIFPFGLGRIRESSYAGTDEVVILGQKITAVKKNSNSPLQTAKYLNQPLQLNADLLGYKVDQRLLPKMLANNPLFLFIAPYTMLGEDQFQLSVGGIYAMQFDVIITTAIKPENTTLTVTLPGTVRLQDYHRNNKLIKTEKFIDAGATYVKYIFKLQDKFYLNPMKMPYLIVEPAAGISPGKLGLMTWQYNYQLGEKHISSQSFKLQLILLPAIKPVPQPKIFITGFWRPYQGRYMVNLNDSIEKIFKFYSSIGFNYAIGGDKAGYNISKKYNVKVMNDGGWVVKNAWRLNLPLQSNQQFKYHSAIKSSYKGIIPYFVYNDKKIYQSLVEKFKIFLTHSDDDYVNWEPYRYMKRGSVDNYSKREFQKFGKLSDVQMAKIWPDCVIAPENKLYNRFSSYEYARAIKVYQRALREAGQQLGKKKAPDFVIAFEPSFMEPGTLWSRAHDPALYFKSLNKVIMWKYDNFMYLNGFDLNKEIGINAPYQKYFNNIKALIKRLGVKHPNGRAKPDVIFMPSEYSRIEKALTMPKDYYYSTLLAFFNRLSGYATWCTTFKLDARYMLMHAKENRIIAANEAFILFATDTLNYRATIVSPHPKKVNGMPVTILSSQSHVLNGKKMISLGNDYYKKITVKLQVNKLDKSKTYIIKDLISQRIYNNAGAGFNTTKMEQGMKIEIAPKEWALLDIIAK